MVENVTNLGLNLYPAGFGVVPDPRAMRKALEKLREKKKAAGAAEPWWKRNRWLLIGGGLAVGALVILPALRKT